MRAKISESIEVVGITPHDIQISKISVGGGFCPTPLVAYQWKRTLNIISMMSHDLVLHYSVST